jgi:HEAT repeat protein
MTIPPKKLAKLLQPDQPAEVRQSAALVIGELGAKDGDVAKAICDVLADEDETVRVRAIVAAGKLGIAPALKGLLARVESGGAGASEAAEAAAQLGSKGVRGLQDLMNHVAPGLRRYIGAALAGAGGDNSSVSALDVLHDSDPGVVEAAVKSLLAQIPNYKPAQHKALASQLLSLANHKKKRMTPVLESAVVRLLAALDDPRIGSAMWDRIAPPTATDIRAIALQALGKWLKSPSKDQLKKLFACAAESNFKITIPAMMLLEHSPAAGKDASEWLKLLNAPDISVRRLAMERIGDRDAKDVAAGLLAQLDHPDRSLRDAALARLTKLKAGREALTKALLAEPAVDKAWSLARVQAPFVSSYPKSWRGPIFTAACKFLENDDRRADPLIFLLREADAGGLRDQLFERAVELRKKKNFAKALQYLKLLARDPGMGLDARFELACCGLKLSNHDLGHEARANDPCLGQFVHLAQADEPALIKQLDKAKWVDPEEIYYVGFHFAEHDPRWRKLGGDLLKLVIKRSPKGKVASAAKSKLKSAGLD